MLHFDLCATLWKDTKNQNFRVIYTNYIPNLYVLTYFFLLYIIYLYNFGLGTEKPSDKVKCIF